MAPNRSVIIAALSLTLSLAATPASAHHDSDTLLGPPQAPAATAPVESVSGTARVFVVDNSLLNTSTRYVAIQLADGINVALTGAGLDSLSNGASVQATGRRSRDTLFLDGYSVISGPSAAALRSTPKQAQGTLAMVHADNFDGGRSTYSLVVRGDDETTTPLRLAVIPDTLKPGMRVTASGTASADGVSIDADRITVLTMPAGNQPTSDPLQTPVTNNVIVILVQFSSDGQPFTQAQVDQVMRTNSNSVANFYQEMSFGQQLLNVTVTPWVQGGTAPSTCDYSAIGNAGNVAATAAGYNLANYQQKFYVFPQRGDCGWAGLAYVGFPYLAWSNGYNQLNVYGHELGHTFGLYHAASLYCPGLVIGGSCSASEYGDPFDVMGNLSSMHFNSAQKSRLGWIAPASVATYTSGSATYTLSPIESPGGSTYAVKIPVSASRTYWLEFRQPIGFDGGMSSYPNNGAQIRVASPFESICGGCGDDTEILDATPGTPNSFGDAALTVGQSFTDPLSNITVSVLSASPTALSVQVSAAGITATTTALSSSLNPSTTGSSVALTATVTGSNPTGNVNFKDGIYSIGCDAVAVTGAGNTRTASCSLSNLLVGTHAIVATYSGDGSNAASASASLAQIVNSGAPALLLNGSFETPALGSGYQYTPSGAGVGWSFSGGSGIEGNGSAFAAASAADGNQAAFIQSTGSIAQTVNLNAGSYALLFRAAQRSCCVSPYVQPIKVTVDGVQIGALVSPQSTSFAAFSVSFVISTAGAHTIAFIGTDTADKTTFIDAVTLATATLGPTTTALSSSLNPSTSGSSVTLTATVTGSNPTGSVNFADGVYSIGCNAVAVTGSGNTRTASCSLSNLLVGTHTIVATYGGDGSNAASASAALTQVVNSGTASSLLNGGFEIPALGSGYQYTPSAAGIGWSFSGASGIEGNGSAWAAASAPDGTQAAFIQSAGSISQTVNLTAGSYTLSFRAAQRSCCVSPYVQPIKITVDGVQIGSLVSPQSAGFASFSVPFTVSTTAAHTIAFTGTDNADKTTFVDAVTLTTANIGTSNVALASSGAVAFASSTYSAGYPASAINNNERAGVNWGNGGGWADGTPNVYPDWVQIIFNGTKTIDHAVVYSVQDNWMNPTEPTDTQTFALYGVTDFSVFGWDGSSWVALGSVSGNNLVKRTVTFSPYTTDRILIYISGALASSSRITEVEAWGN